SSKVIVRRRAQRGRSASRRRPSASGTSSNATPTRSSNAAKRARSATSWKVSTVHDEAAVTVAARRRYQASIVAHKSAPMVIGGPPRSRAPASRAHHNGRTVHRPRDAEPRLVRHDLVHEAIRPARRRDWLGRRLLARVDEDDAAGAHVAPPLAEVAGDP